jgi:hypothetical protein
MHVVGSAGFDIHSLNTSHDLCFRPEELLEVRSGQSARLLRSSPTSTPFVLSLITSSHNSCRVTAVAFLSNTPCIVGGCIAEQDGFEVETFVRGARQRVQLTDLQTDLSTYLCRTFSVGASAYFQKWNVLCCTWY